MHLDLRTATAAGSALCRDATSLEGPHLGVSRQVQATPFAGSSGEELNPPVREYEVI